MELRNDAVVAVLGIPIAHEDDAQRALRAAAELRDEVPFGVCSGACTGEVLAAGDPPVIGEGHGRFRERHVDDVRNHDVAFDQAQRLECGGNHGSDQVTILGHGLAGNRIDDVLGIRPRDAAILQRIVVVADALQIGLMKRLPASGRLVTN